MPTDARKSCSALIVAAVDTGLWRVHEDGGDTLLHLYSKDAALHFAESWARVHGFGEIRLYGPDGTLEDIFLQTAHPISTQD